MFMIFSWYLFWHCFLMSLASSLASSLARSLATFHYTSRKKALQPEYFEWVLTSRRRPFPNICVCFFDRILKHFWYLWLHFGFIFYAFGSTFFAFRIFLVSFWLHVGPFGFILTLQNRFCALNDSPKSERAKSELEN